MQRKALAAWILLALALLFGFLGRGLEADPLYLLSGICFLSAAGIAVSFLPVWSRLRERVPVMPGLFPRLHGRRWDPATGRPVRRRSK